jgi:hypothetical protein
MSDRFQVTGSPTQFWVDAGKTATITNIGNSTVYGSPDLPPISTTVAAWSLVAGASRTEDVGTVWVRCATGASSTLTVEPVASGLAVDTGTGIPSAVSGGSGAASGVTFTPTGTIAATDVQAAIAENATDAIARENAIKGAPLALTGATAATRYVGGTASGAPATGTFAVGDFVIDQTGKVYVCTTAGSPGTWSQVGGSAAVAEGRFKDSSGTVHYGVPGIELNTTNSTVTRTAAKLYYEPMFVSTPITLDQLLIRVQTAGAAGNVARLGIYAADTDWQPSSLVVDAGAVAVDTTGVKSVTISQALAAGRYLLTYISDGAPIIYCNAASLRFHPLWAPSGNQDYVTDFTAARAYGALPTTPAAWAAANGGGAFKHAVFTRISVA